MVTIRIIIWENAINSIIDNIWEFAIEKTKENKYPKHIQDCFDDAIEQLKLGKKVSIELVQ